MDYKQRKKEIQDLRDAGQTLQQIGDVYGLTRERVRQILDPNIFKCKAHCEIHDHWYNKSGSHYGCKYCRKTVAEIRIQKMMDTTVDKTTLTVLINKVKKKDRHLVTVELRDYVIKILRVQEGLSLPKIGRLLERTHTAILHSLHKNEQ
jgi:DNA-binding transcriptional MerR regulator